MREEREPFSVFSFFIHVFGWFEVHFVIARVNESKSEFVFPLLISHGNFTRFEKQFFFEMNWFLSGFKMTHASSDSSNETTHEIVFVNYASFF